MTSKKTVPIDAGNPTKRLGDLDPREEAPDQQAGIKGGIQPPHGLNLTAHPPLDPPSG